MIGPTNGVLSGIAPDILYTPGINYTGMDSFTFKVNDGTVDSPPVAVAIITTMTQTFSISGTTGVAGATLNYLDGAAKMVTADSSGNYSFNVSPGWTGTVTPAKAGYVFTPPSRAYTDVTANLANQNYAATVTFTSVGKYDGWILESAETSNKGGSFNAIAKTFQLGDDALDRQYKTILSFRYNRPAR